MYVLHNMILSRQRAFLVLFVTLAPLLLYALAVASGDEKILVVLGLFAVFLTLGLMVFYLIHLYGTAHLEMADRILWLWLIVFGNLLAMPVYWYLHVRPKQPDKAA